MRKLTQEEFIDKVNKVFPEYDFSKAVYMGSHAKVIVGCEHGYWESRAKTLLKGHTGCKICTIEKKKETMLRHYGVEFVLQSSELNEKMRKTMLERYGVENPSHSADLNEKRNEIFLERYGANPLQSSEFKEKIKESMFNRYGVEYALQSSEFKEKKKETMLKRYGKEV